MGQPPGAEKTSRETRGSSPSCACSSLANPPSQPSQKPKRITPPRRHTSLALATFALTATACQDDQNLWVQSTVQLSADFTAYRTFAFAPEPSEAPAEAPPPFVALERITASNAIRRELTALNLTETDDLATADLAIALSLAQETYQSLYVDYPWGYGPYWNQPWGWGYGGGRIITRTIVLGRIVVEHRSRHSPTAQQPPEAAQGEAVFTGAVELLISSSSATTSARVDEGLALLYSDWPQRAADNVGQSEVEQTPPSDAGGGDFIGDLVDDVI